MSAHALVRQRGGGGSMDCTARIAAGAAVKGATMIVHLDRIQLHILAVGRCAFISVERWRGSSGARCAVEGLSHGFVMSRSRELRLWDRAGGAVERAIAGAEASMPLR